MIRTLLSWNLKENVLLQVFVEYNDSFQLNVDETFYYFAFFWFSINETNIYWSYSYWSQSRKKSLWWKFWILSLYNYINSISLVLLHFIWFRHLPFQFWKRRKRYIIQFVRIMPNLNCVLKFHYNYVYHKILWCTISLIKEFKLFCVLLQIT